MDAADVAVEIGSYLDADAVVDAARRAGARSVHPGYGFLSENAAFARAVAGAGLAWIGPPPEAIELMGDKARAKALAREAGVPVVPGVEGEDVSLEEVRAFADEHGYPVVIKAVAGGGGKGMRAVRDAACSSRRARRGAPRGQGGVRRRARARRALPRAPAPHRDPGAGRRARRGRPPRRARVLAPAPPPEGHRGGALAGRGRRRCARAMGEAAVALARACGYAGAGTVEFIAPADASEFFFLEMNTRLQVEHPVTELVYGVDLVEQQLRVAAGEPLALEPGRAVPARPRGRGAPVRGGPGERVPARGRHRAALRRAARACGWTPASARAAWSARTTTRCWPR